MLIAPPRPEEIAVEVQSSADTATSPATEANPASASKAVIQTVISLVVLFALFFVVFSLFREPILSFGGSVAKTLGLPGAFLFVYAIDTLVTPMSADVLFASVSAWEPVSFLATISVASILAGMTGYWIGRGLNHIPALHKVADGIRRKGGAMVERYGFWAIVLAALTPIPYSLVSWTCGVVRMKYSTFVIGCLFRAPRMVIYYLAIQAGIALAL